MDKDKNDAGDGQVQGEGNYDASRQYRRETEQFIRSGKVERAAREAADTSPEEQGELERAEQEGRKHAAEEDPQLRRPGSA